MPWNPTAKIYDHLFLSTPHSSSATPQFSISAQGRSLSPPLPEMGLLEMPLDLLAFRFYPLTAIAASSLLTWLAVIAAAVGLWRIRSAGSRSDVSALPSPPPPPPPPPHPSPRLAGADVGAPAREEAEPMAPSPSTLKVRFTAYYDVACGGGFRHVDKDREEEMEVDDGDGVSEPVDGAGVQMTAPWTGGASRWEGMVVVGWRGDLGWYDYQDITALNGRVVRLWDGEGGLTAAQKRRSRMGRYAF